MTTGCACWNNTHAIGHDGHCCFAPGHNGERFKADADVCHIPPRQPHGETMATKTRPRPPQPRNTPSDALWHATYATGPNCGTDALDVHPATRVCHRDTVPFGYKAPTPTFSSGWTPARDKRTEVLAKVTTGKAGERHLRAVRDMLTSDDGEYLEWAQSLDSVCQVCLTTLPVTGVCDWCG